MTKEELLSLLRSAGVDENTMTFASNVYDMAVDYMVDLAEDQGFTFKGNDE
jgi:hypothetical protein